MGSKFIPVGSESPRLLDPVAVELHWIQPWCCWGCRTYGRVEIGVDKSVQSSDGEIADKVNRAHRNRSSLCLYEFSGSQDLGIEGMPRPEHGIVGGRIYRIRPSTMQKIYLRAKGEREQDVKEQAWPPWAESR